MARPPLEHILGPPPLARSNPADKLDRRDAVDLREKRKFGVVLRGRMNDQVFRRTIDRLNLDPSANVRRMDFVLTGPKEVQSLGGGTVRQDLRQGNGTNCI